MDQLYRLDLFHLECLVRLLGRLDLECLVRLLGRLNLLRLLGQLILLHLLGQCHLGYLEYLLDLLHQLDQVLL